MYCKNCAKEIDDKAVICPSCGVSQVSTPQVIDNGGFGWGVLGCCIPVVGLVLYLVWKDTKPKTSKAAGIGALVSVVGMIIIYAFMFGLGIIGAMESSGY